MTCAESRAKKHELAFQVRVPTDVWTHRTNLFWNENSVRQTQLNHTSLKLYHFQSWDRIGFIFSPLNLSFPVDALWYSYKSKSIDKYRNWTTGKSENFHFVKSPCLSKKLNLHGKWKNQKILTCVLSQDILDQTHVLKNAKFYFAFKIQFFTHEDLWIL